MLRATRRPSSSVRPSAASNGRTVMESAPPDRRGEAGDRGAQRVHPRIALAHHPRRGDRVQAHRPRRLRRAAGLRDRAHIFRAARSLQMTRNWSHGDRVGEEDLPAGRIDVETGRRHRLQVGHGGRHRGREILASRSRRRRDRARCRRLRPSRSGSARRCSARGRPSAPSRYRARPAACRCRPSAASGSALNAPLAASGLICRRCHSDASNAAAGRNCAPASRCDTVTRSR